ncbi:hypothetical protein G7Y79_00077g099820 [Physcia stellaris]|nr:hypothetical protein G7Y79_00077g099820 [Physcia stellaris]
MGVAFTADKATIFCKSAVLTHSLRAPQFAARQNSQTKHPLNGYDIMVCGNPHDPISKANKLLGSLFLMKGDFEKTITDAQLGTRSQHGFTAFFKSNRNIAKVVAAYRNIADGNPVIVSGRRAAGRGDWAPQLVFLCINDGDTMAAPILAQCRQRNLELVFIKPGIEGSWYVRSSLMISAMTHSRARTWDRM